MGPWLLTEMERRRPETLTRSVRPNPPTAGLVALKQEGLLPSRPPNAPRQTPDQFIVVYEQRPTLRTKTRLGLDASQGARKELPAPPRPAK